MALYRNIGLLALALALACPIECSGPRKGALRYGRTVPDNRNSCSTCGEPLNLSPLLKEGRIEEARNLSAVHLPLADGQRIPSHSGYYESDEAAGNNMFWWYFPAQSGDLSAPLVIWLQGGPGGSSLMGLFAEMGPYSLTPASPDTKLTAVLRESSWNKKYGMLFIDNPVGAGFSYTTKNGYCNDTKGCVAKNLYSVIDQFYVQFPDQRRVELWITGESYGGHYVPGFAYYIHKQNQGKAEADKVPLAGIAVGDGWIDPINMVPGYPDMIYNFGLVSELEKARIQKYCDDTVANIRAGNMLQAFGVWDEFLNGDVWPYSNYFHNVTGLNDYDNYMNTDAPASLEYYATYLNYPEVQRALHVGSRPFPTDPDECERHLLSDFMVSFTDCLGGLLDAPENYRISVYSGQLDVIIGAALTERFLARLAWRGADAYKRALKKVWRLTPQDREVAGYVREVGNFTYTVVRGAGHLVPFDQGWRALDMIEHLIERKPYEHQPNPLPRSAAVAAPSLVV
uniref:Carboxypeptidase n=1 Tax=Alexandrium catenella TaxID=2925 RepID=A0A7S1S0W9_ALECA|mmetsp:Transcript_81796/g.217073  ORF Transcript_81796/g.217073 Transcript_81796/m.217073 type:complete len:512 (+) Transcript_81796:63-1598(+)